MPLVDQQVNIALVYLGNRLPKYARANLNYLSHTFPLANVWLITDSQKTKEKIEKSGFNAWLFVDSDSYWTEIAQKMNFPSEFRRGFWFLTLKRFKALEMFMDNHKGPLLHVEADVFLMPSFPIENILSIARELAFPIVGSGSAIASTLLLHDFEAIRRFNRFVEKQTKGNANATDMTLLFEYWQQYPERVEVLPSGPDHKGNASGYFDGAAFGTYLIGQDPRNFRGYTLKYSPIVWHSDKVQRFDYRISDHSLLVGFDGVEKPLYSLHVHTKNPKLFQQNNMINELNSAINEHTKGARKVLTPRVLFPILVAAIQRRIKRILHED